MSTLAQDLRYAIRALRTNPGFSIVAVLSLAIGIGANTAIFSVASALLLRPLQYANADRQVILWNTSPGLGIMEDWFSTAQYFDIKNNTQSFENVAIAIGANSNLTGDGEPERDQSLERRDTADRHRADAAKGQGGPRGTAFQGQLAPLSSLQFAAPVAMLRPAIRYSAATPTAIIKTTRRS